MAAGCGAKAGSQRRKRAACRGGTPPRGDAYLSHPRANERERIVGRKLRALGVASAAILEFPALEAALAHHDPVGDAQQLGIGELDARAGIAIVVENLDSRCRVSSA